MSHSSEQASQTTLSRRALLQMLGVGAAGLALGQTSDAVAQSEQAAQALPSFTGPEANPYWNSVGPYVTYPQKVPLLRLTDRSVQLETPRHYFRDAFTPTEAFFVRWHLSDLPNAVDLAEWRLSVEGNVDKPLKLSLADLLKNFEAVSVAAVNECSGNSRSFFQPRVPGGQWGHGAMGNALWTGVRLRDLLDAAGVKKGSVQVQFEGLERGVAGSEAAQRFMKSWDLNEPAVDEGVIAYAMNGEPLPMLNGFPLRAVFPGKFATYWTKALTWIRVLSEPDDNYWMTTAYRIPNTPDGSTTPEAVAAETVELVPIGTVNLPVRSFIVTPDGSSKVPVGLPVTARGVAFSGYGRVNRVEFSADDGRTWSDATLGEDYGQYSFRTWEASWTPESAGDATLAVRATDEAGNTQPDEGVWNSGGYLWNKIERQTVQVGAAG